MIKRPFQILAIRVIIKKKDGVSDYFNFRNKKKYCSSSSDNNLTSFSFSVLLNEKTWISAENVTYLSFIKMMFTHGSSTKMRETWYTAQTQCTRAGDIIWMHIFNSFMTKVSII